MSASSVLSQAYKEQKEEQAESLTHYVGWLVGWLFVFFCEVFILMSCVTVGLFRGHIVFYWHETAHCKCC